MGTDHKHRVCTFDEVEKAIKAREVIYVNDCFCRTPAKEGKMPWEYCGHPTDVCMGLNKPEGEFAEKFPSKEISREEALERFENWKKEGGFFRYMEDESWVCSCCACGCGWFRGEEGNRQKDPCDKSAYIEKTDMEKCATCGDCAKVCAFDARKIVDDKIAVDSENCYGCSACEYACEQNAIEMIPR